MNLQTFWENFEVIAEAPGGVQRLRELILDLAVRGKLSKIHEQDGTAAHSIERIACEKLALFKAKAISKPKETQSVESTEIPFELPSNWQWVRVETVCTHVVDCLHRTPIYQKDGYPAIRTSDMRPGEILIEQARRVGLEEYQRQTQRLQPRPGDIFYSREGNFGIAAVVPNNCEICLSQRMMQFRVAAEIEPYFFSWAMNSSLIYGQARKDAAGMTVPHVNIRSLKKFIFPLPPLAEQKRIVAKVDELMALCDRYEVLQCDRNTLRTKMRASAIDALMNAETDESLNTAWEFVQDNWACLSQQLEDVEDIRLSISQLAVQGRLTEQNDLDGLANMLLAEVRTQMDELVQKKIIKKIVVEKISPDKQPHLLPVSWEWIRLGDILTSLRYGTSKKCGYDAVGSPVLRIPNIQVADGCLNIQDLKFAVLTDKERKDLQVQPGDLLMIRSNGSKALVGRTAVVTDEENGYAYAGYLVRLRPFPGSCDAIYLNLAIGSVTTRQQIEYPIRTTSGVKNINSKEIASLLLPLPPLAEQKRIVAKVDRLMPLCDTLETHLRKTQDKATALAAAVVGQLEV
ncbi:restriction endonuclease subunit S [Acaryochloris sp. 'Moss Beach']|uniref:restriction endonuclease subunit S n=1 Tax=Acaryochloris sp. 'Moss Beach' TaxID=2740837 RepID=UPI001F1D76A7|nr:restriction endonuclease subunit S [Acaryochloris sp. 'Moss Beach']UJB71091.1 restriction endonuclease subunit S [Acaryochloris sp. 'Moss Beach']